MPATVEKGKMTDVASQMLLADPSMALQNESFQGDPCYAQEIKLLVIPVLGREHWPTLRSQKGFVS